MKKIITLLMLLIILPAAVAAADLKIHKNKKGKFTVKYPADWTIKIDEGGKPFLTSAPDNGANVQVLVDTVKDKSTACAYLAQLDASAPGGRTNLVPEDRRNATAAQVKFMGVKDGCIGAYKIMEGETEVMQGIGVYMNGKSVWILIQTLQSAMRQTHGKAVGDIAKSFTTK